MKLLNSKFKEGTKCLKKALNANPNDVVVEQWIFLAEKGIRDPINFKIKSYNGRFGESYN